MLTRFGSIRYWLQRFQTSKLPHGYCPYSRKWKPLRKKHGAELLRFAKTMREIAGEIEAWVHRGTVAERAMTFCSKCGQPLPAPARVDPPLPRLAAPDPITIHDLPDPSKAEVEKIQSTASGGTPLFPYRLVEE